MSTTYAQLDDPVTTISKLLDDNWTSARTDSTKPSIGDSWDLNKVNLKDTDVVRCYEIASSHDFLGVGKGVDRTNSRISIYIATKVSRSRLRKLYSEVVSIIRNIRAGAITLDNTSESNGTYSEIKLLSRIDQSDKQRRWYRYVLDCELTSYEAVI